MKFHRILIKAKKSISNSRFGGAPYETIPAGLRDGTGEKGISRCNTPIPFLSEMFRNFSPTMKRREKM